MAAYWLMQDMVKQRQLLHKTDSYKKFGKKVLSRAETNDDFHGLFNILIVQNQRWRLRIVCLALETKIKYIQYNAIQGYVKLKA